MTPQQLKNSILQQAIEGKLVEQIPEEGTGEELYQQIQKEKQKLIKEGKIKKEKPLPPITEDEIPFEIPESWKWCRLGKIISLLSGADFKPSEYNSDHNGIPYMTGASNIDNDSLIINRWTTAPRCIANKGDLLIVCKGSGYGKTVICNIDKVHIARQFMALKAGNNLNLSYIRILLEANVKNIKKQGKGVIPGIERSDILNMQCPLPPLAEQKRIVAKIEELQLYLDQYEQAYNRLESFNRKFPDDMKKSILQMAIEGKLVEQRPEDGTGEELYQQIQKEKQKLIKEGKIKKEKSLPPITEDEIPFEIPENWKWVRIENIGEVITGSTPSKSHLEYYGNSFPLFKPADLDEGPLIVKASEYLSDIGKKKVRIIPKGSVAVCCIGSIGKSAILGIDGTTNQQINSISYYPYPDYLYIYCCSNLFISQLQFLQSMTTLPIVNKSKMKSCFFPLPPLAEQKRIVAKIEELLPLCDQLTTN